VSVGVSNYRGGLTTRKRVSAQDRSVLEVCSGWKTADGSLKLDDLVSKVTTGAALPGTTPQQVPFAHSDGTTTKIIARNSAEAIREHASGVWGSSQGTVDILPESIPAKLRQQVVFPTGGANAKLMVYEPDSPSTKIRPLSLKGPTDYYPDAPALGWEDQGDNDPEQIFDITDANPWTGTAAAYTTSSIVNEPPAAYVNLLVASTATASAQAFTKSLGAGIDLAPGATSRRFMVIDMKLDVEFHDYATSWGPTAENLFSNDLDLTPSGYTLSLYSDTACTAPNLIRSFDIPTCTRGVITRLVFHLPELTDVVRGVSIGTASYFTAPTTSDTITLYSIYGGMTELENRGNKLCHSIRYTLDVFDEVLTDLDNTPINVLGVRQNVIPLQTYSMDSAEWSPRADVEYCYCFCAKNLLGDAFFENMVSNPSEESITTELNPWQRPTVTIFAPYIALTIAEAIAEYGNYLTHVLYYRRTYNSTTDVWSNWEFVTSDPIGTIAVNTDTGTNDTPTINGASVPEILEITNGYASSARHAIFCDDRVYAGCLDWSNSLGKWQRPTAIEVSSEGKHWAFPTTTDSESLPTDGGELAVPVETGSEIRGMLKRNQDKFVFLDNEMFLLQGDSPVTGYRFWRIGGVGAKANTMAECRGFLVWHDGKHFQAYAGGTDIQAISEFEIDSTLIDWTQPYGACYCDNRYLFFCTHNSEHALIIYDLPSGGMPGSWRIRYSDALDIVGICTDGQDVYGVTPTGNVVNLFGGPADYGAQSPVREVFTQYIALAPTEYDTHIKQFVMDAVAASACTVNVTLRTHSKANGFQSIEIPITATRTRYEKGVNLECNAVKIEVTYAGTVDLQILSMGVVTGEVASQ
jgi:hypothetical protein